MCSVGVAGIATSCEAARALAQDLARRRSDRTLAADPARERLRWLDHGGARPKDTRPHPSPWIRAAADFTESLNGTDEIATGKVSVSVPASLFGF
jgi:hypothetical protein